MGRRLGYARPVSLRVCTMRVIHHSRSLGILSCIQGALIRKIAQRPSWVADFGRSVCQYALHGHFDAAGTGDDSQHLLLPLGNFHVCARPSKVLVVN